MVILKNCNLNKDEPINGICNKNSRNFTLVTDENNNIMGLLSYSILDIKLIKIEYITLFNEFRGKNIGTEVIKILRSRYEGFTIIGESLPTENAISFWKSLDAKLEISRDIESHKESRIRIPFSI